MANGGIDYWQALLPQLDRLGIELDQRMQQAWDECASLFVTDVQLLTSLLRLGTRGTECLPANWLTVARQVQKRLPYALNAFPDWDRCHPSQAEIAAHFDVPIWMRAVELAGQERRPGGKTALTCSSFLRAISQALLNPWTGQPADAPPMLEFLAICHDERADSLSFHNDCIPQALEGMPRTRGVIEAMGQVLPGPDDFQYALCLQGGEIAFRAVSILGDYVIGDAGTTRIAGRCLLTHFQKQFGAFTPDEIAELEEMIRNPRSGERDFQAFFENHPHFFRRWDHRQVHPQVYLVRDGQGPLVPDFILTNPDLQQALIVELKLPRPKLVRRRQNRDRFASAIEEARTQLLEYRDWFREKTNRKRLVGHLHMEAYEPRLSVIIGRSADFHCGMERQKLAARAPDVEVVTYDDMVAYAKERLIRIGG